MGLINNCSLSSLIEIKIIYQKIDDFSFQIELEIIFLNNCNLIIYNKKMLNATL